MLKVLFLLAGSVLADKKVFRIIPHSTDQVVVLTALGGESSVTNFVYASISIARTA